MKANQGRFHLNPVAAAVRFALLAVALVPAAYAADPPATDPDVAALTKPASRVEAGVGYVSDDSAKFGEYNGLNKTGAYGILTLAVRGGEGYGSDTDATRWRITGTNLGLDVRNINGEYGQQGKFRVDLGYDELRRNRSDTYQTPYSGAGGNLFTLPSNWLPPRVPQVSATNINFRSFSPSTGLAPALVNGVSTPPTAAQQTTVNNILANDVPAFQNVDLYTKRERYDGGFTYNITRQWEVKASVRHEDKTGYKPMSTVSSQVSEFAATLPDPIDQSTDQYRLSLNYTGDKGFFQAAYYGSIFKNNVQTLTWQDVNDLTKFATMGSAPDNQYHRIGLTGGYRFTNTTKLVMNAAMARGTQNENFVTGAQNNQLPLGLPANSLNGLVVTKIFNAKLTSRPMKDLSLVAAYKYDDRDNRTSINTYFFQDANENRAGTATNPSPSPFNSALGLAPNTLASNINIYNNRPYSKTLNQANLDASYRLAKGQSIDAGYEFQKLDRSCTGSWIDCADANTTKENTGRIEWKAKLTETVAGRVSYAYSQRKVDNYNENAFLALVPMANFLGVGGAATNGTTVATQSALAYMIANGLTGYGPLAGFSPPYTGNALIYGNNGGIIPQALYGSRNNINELPGMRRFNMADRNRDKVRSLVNWEATEQLSFQGGIDYNKDDYDNSVFGLKSAQSYSLNFEGTYVAAEDLTASLFYTFEDIRSKTAGDAYGANSNTANVNGATGIDPVVCYGTILARNLNGKQDPCLQWNTDMHDKVDTLGFTVRKTGLMGGRLRLGGDLTYSRQSTDIGVNGGSYANNPFAVAGAPAGTIAAFFIAAQNLPNVTVKTTTLRLNAQYQIDKSSAVGFLYIYEKLSSNDWAYQGMQLGTGTNYLPTNEKSPNYNVNVVGVAYSYRFR
ncbi:MAG: MtrB/PioB family decaheme-associated outer membrane protein [Usitatibacter sp.]